MSDKTKETLERFFVFVLFLLTAYVAYHFLGEKIAMWRIGP